MARYYLLMIPELGYWNGGAIDDPRSFVPFEDQAHQFKTLASVEHCADQILGTWVLTRYTVEAR